MKTLAKLVLLGSLYFAQGLPFGFFTQALPVLLRTHGVSLGWIGLAQLLTLPWALKFLWAPLIDRHARRRVIIPLQLASCAVMAALALAEPEMLWALNAAVLAVNLISATQDIATDGLAVDVLEPDERGLGNGLQVGAYRIGMIVGGGFVLWLFARAGWTIAIAALAGFLVLSTLPIVLHRERPRVIARAPALGSIGSSFARLGGWIAVLATFKTGEWFASGMLRVYFLDAGQTLEELATILGVVGFSCALAGAMIGGALTPVLGRRTALLVFGSLQALAIAAVALATVMPSTEMFYAIAAAEHLTGSMATAALFTTMMDFCRPTHAGTDYTVQACLVVIASGVASALSGFSAAAIGYGPHFLVAAGMAVAGVIVVATFQPRRELAALAPPWRMLGSRADRA